MRRLLLLTVFACNGPPGAPHGATGLTAPVPETPPIEVTDPNCASYVFGAGPLTSAWLDGAIATAECLTTAPRHDPPQFYDACVEESSSPEQCGIEPGAQACRAGHWTVACRRNGDCPSG